MVGSDGDTSDSPRFAYNLEAFTFFVDGQRAWGVTSALEALGLYPPAKDYQRHLGRAVHTAVELHFLYGVGPERHTPHVRARLAQYVRFLDREQLTPVACEVFSFAHLNGVPVVAITDLVVLTRDNTLRLIDIKTGPDRYPNNLQTAAGVLTLQRLGLDIPERQVVSLHEDRVERSWHRRQRDFDDLTALFTKLGQRPGRSYEADLSSVS